MRGLRRNSSVTKGTWAQGGLGQSHDILYVFARRVVNRSSLKSRPAAPPDTFAVRPGADASPERTRWMPRNWPITRTRYRASRFFQDMIGWTGLWLPTPTPNDLLRYFKVRRTGTAGNESSRRRRSGKIAEPADTPACATLTRRGAAAVPEPCTSRRPPDAPSLRWPDTRATRLMAGYQAGDAACFDALYAGVGAGAAPVSIRADPRRRPR